MSQANDKFHSEMFLTQIRITASDPLHGSNKSITESGKAKEKGIFSFIYHLKKKSLFILRESEPVCKLGRERGRGRQRIPSRPDVGLEFTQ